MSSKAECPQPSPPPEVDPSTEELRLAIALNGGVSLAVWMGGAAVELDRARRAGSAVAPTERRVYDALCECFGRRLVIDILTGSSAGGINGALLGAAMASAGRLPAKFLRDRWIELGDLGSILHAPTDESPTALMDGERFHTALLKTFEELLEPNEGPANADTAAALVPDLDVTMTDVIGVERRFRDAWGAELVAREHRPRFRFRRQEHYTAEALAAAARTSASFPFAFDPWRVWGDPRVLAGLPRPTYGIDGGLLDNAPIREALELIPSQPAGSSVRRYICYINADPTLSRRDDPESPLPKLKEVGGYVVSLPRSAPLVDHLYAIRDAVERPQRAAKVQPQLLTMPLKQLRGMARTLFDAYRRRRTLESLEELLSEPGDASAMFDVLEETGGTLPWIPASLKVPDREEWGWGARCAQRILHLLLDLLREPIRLAGKPADRERLLRTRRLIQDELSKLGETRQVVITEDTTRNPSRFDEETAAERVNRAAARTTEREQETREALAIAIAAFRRGMAEHDSLRRRWAKALFASESPNDPGGERHFLRRVLAIEVVRRALSAEADIDNAEPLRFVQLTPDAPSPIFTSRPRRRPGPTAAKQKLTGVGLDHFAGFFRRSWRANDFMWGRLDAAARVVDLLLDVPSPQFGRGAGAEPEERIGERSAMLADALLENHDERLRDELAWLAEEALEEHAVEGEQELPLRQRLICRIEAELRAHEDDVRNPLPLLRALFQRAAQLEILAEELGELRKESRQDRKLGSDAKPLELSRHGPDTELRQEIEQVRKIYAAESSLPQRLTAEGEAVSNLGLQTITRAAFVGLEVIKTAGVPMSKYLGFARPPLLAVAGVVSSSWWRRAAAVLGFWAAAVYLTSRAVSTEAIPVTIDLAWSPQTLVALVALLGALGFVAVPGLRARQHVSPVKNLLYAAALVLAGGGLAAILALSAGGLDVKQLLFAPGADSPPEEVLWGVLGAVGIVSLARLPWPTQLEGIAKTLDQWRRGGPWMPAILAAAFLTLMAFAGQTLIRAIDGWSWQTFAALTALGVAPLVAAAVVRLWKLR